MSPLTIISCLIYYNPWMYTYHLTPSEKAQMLKKYNWLNDFIPKR